MKRTLLVATICLVLGGCSDVTTSQAKRNIRVKGVFIENIQCSDPATAAIFREYLKEEFVKNKIIVYDGLTKQLAQVVITGNVFLGSTIQVSGPSDSNVPVIRVESALIKASTTTGEQLSTIIWNHPGSSIKEIASNTGHMLVTKLRQKE